MKCFDANLILGEPGTHSAGVLSAAALLSAMDRWGVEAGLVTHIGASLGDPETGNALLANAVSEAAGGRLRPVPVMPLKDPGAPGFWDEWRSRGSPGVRICPECIAEHADDEFLDATLQELARRGGFLQVAVLPYHAAKIRTGSLDATTRAAARRPDVNVLLSCVTRSEFVRALRALREHSNLHLDVGGLTTATAIPELVEAGLADRLVCGSGFGVSYLPPFFDTVRYSGIPEEAQQAILHDNAVRLVSRST